MKHPIYVLALAISLPVFAAPLTQGERDRALSELYATRKQFLDTVAGLSAAQWNFKPDAKSWSVGEIAEHLALAEDFLFQQVSDVLKSPAQPGKKSTVTDEHLLQAGADRSHKYQAPEALAPKHRFATQAEAAAHFRQSRDRTLDYVRHTSNELRAHFAAHPAFGELDAYQWVLYISSHTDRHVQQMNEVKNNTAFPKN